MSDEVEQALARYLELRDQMERRDVPYSSMADLFSPDAVFVDVAHGRIEGREQIREFLTRSTDTLEFRFPVDAHAASGNWAFVRWRQVLPGTKPDGRRWEQSGVSSLLYGGGGLWCYQEDLMNMTHVMEDIVASGWQPPEGYEMPPEHPDRNFAVPPRRGQPAAS